MIEIVFLFWSYKKFMSVALLNQAKQLSVALLRLAPALLVKIAWMSCKGVVLIFKLYKEFMSVALLNQAKKKYECGTSQSSSKHPVGARTTVRSGYINQSNAFKLGCLHYLGHFHFLSCLIHWLTYWVIHWPSTLGAGLFPLSDIFMMRSNISMWLCEICNLLKSLKYCRTNIFWYFETCKIIGSQT